MHVFASVNHTVMISPQLSVLERIVWPSDSFVQLHYLMMGKGGTKHAGVLLIKTLKLVSFLV
jgi:hypothetical protein